MAVWRKKQNQVPYRDDAEHGDLFVNSGSVFVYRLR